jgi:hypothetical protein
MIEARANAGQLTTAQVELQVERENPQFVEKRGPLARLPPCQHICNTEIFITIFPFAAKAS